MRKRRASNGMPMTSLLLEPPLADIDLLDWNAYERAIEAGYRHAQTVLGRAAPLRVSCPK